MSAIGKLAASIISGTQETTLALAQVNFDFSLYKVEAPVEFRELGEALSSQRRLKAERGSQHITARKLEALFGQILPPTPNLIKAYGSRASEIAKLPNINLTNQKSNGIFADHVGIDGTSIWAAATSGNEAILVHLLACMLARVWSPAEATSIWAQIIDERKQELRATTDALNLSAIAALEVTVTSEQLAEWDASARAWLATADKVMEKQQKQLMLILGNINLLINGKMNVYESVLQAWKSATSMVENLIGGMGQRVNDGAVLLGLSAWHLYPCLTVLSHTSTEVRFNDHLLSQGGILTIGLQNSSPHSQDGVTWSLPLSFLKYYGSPVLSTKSLGSQASRVSMSQLMQVAFGSIMRDCKLVDMDPLKAARFVQSLASCVEKFETAPSWLALLDYTAGILLTSECSNQESLKRLISFGSRRCARFLTSALKPAGGYDVFGLCNPTLFLGLINSPEARISILRDFAHRMHLRPGTCIIRVKDTRGIEFFATAVPCSLEWKYHRSKKHDGPVQHFRWYEKSNSEERNRSIISYQGTEETKLFIEQGSIYADNEYLSWQHPPSCFPHTPWGELQPRHRILRGRSRAGPYLNLAYKFGDEATAILYYLDSDIDKPDSGKVTTEFSPDDVIRAFQEDRVSGGKLSTYFKETEYFKSDQFCSLEVLSNATKIYEQLEGASVSLEITSQPVCQMNWARKHLKMITKFTDRPALSRGETFACIASFESGSPHFTPDELNEVMAMSAGDSIFVSASLLQDPYDISEPWQVARINGNIGKAGIAMMIPPQVPLVKELENDTWNMINHEEFDGGLHNAFQGTSLHLTFSEYSSPINLGSHGSRFREAFFLESLVSIYDEGVWIADLDILGALENKSFSRAGITELDCFHSKKSKYKKQEQKAFKRVRLTSIDSWIEFLDRPEGMGIVRSHKNWLGRLAAAVLSVQKGYETRVLPNEFCWGCLIYDQVLEEGSKSVEGATIAESQEHEYDENFRQGSDSAEQKNVQDIPMPILIC